MKVFYAWQSSTPEDINRNLIREAIQQAISRLKSIEQIKNIELHEATTDEFSNVDIAEAIFTKISDSQCFVCDATIITPRNRRRASPNPNVLIEYGYAAAELGWERILVVANTHYGRIEQLPFDMRHRLVLPFALDEQTVAAREEQLGKMSDGIYDFLREHVYLPRPHEEFIYKTVEQYIFPLRIYVAVVTWLYPHIQHETDDYELWFVLLEHLAQYASDVGKQHLPNLLVNWSAALSKNYRNRLGRVIESTNKIASRVQFGLVIAQKNEAAWRDGEPDLMNWLTEHFRNEWLPRVAALSDKYSLAELLYRYLGIREEKPLSEESLQEIARFAGRSVESVRELQGSPDYLAQSTENVQVLSQGMIIKVYKDREIADEIWRLIQRNLA